jgi:diadenosine tetraphosphate (Ap4A) HIT family hydrolase
MFRVVLVRDAGFPGWWRVVWHEHVAELTDLPADERQAAFDAVVAVELALRSELAPHKINIASLGTAIPHLTSRASATIRPFRNLCGFRQFERRAERIW